MQDFEVLTTQVNSPLDSLNGKFTLSVNSLDYRDEGSDNFQDYFSTIQVRVENSEVIVNDLVKACNELHKQTGYWGRYIESLDYDTESNTIRVEFGS
jgi:hypothetical protein